MTVKAAMTTAAVLTIDDTPGDGSKKACQSVINTTNRTPKPFSSAVVA
jgi:hypothetical protein